MKKRRIAANARERRRMDMLNKGLILDFYLAHVIKQPNLQIPNPQYLQLNFCFDFLMILKTHFEASLRFRRN